MPPKNSFPYSSPRVSRCMSVVPPCDGNADVLFTHGLYGSNIVFNPGLFKASFHEFLQMPALNHSIPQYFRRINRYVKNG